MASSKIKILIHELCEYLPQEGNAPSGARGDEKTLAIDISNLTMSDVSVEDLGKFFFCYSNNGSDRTRLIYFRKI